MHWASAEKSLKRKFKFKIMNGRAQICILELIIAFEKLIFADAHLQTTYFCISMALEI